MKNVLAATSAFVCPQRETCKTGENIFQPLFRLCSIVSRETICIKFENNLDAMSDYRMNVCDARFVTFAKRSG